MDQKLLIDLSGYLGGIFLMISFLPQVVKTWRTKESDQISVLLLVLTLISGVFYNIYAFALWLVPVLIMNSIFFTIGWYSAISYAEIPKLNECRNEIEPK